jgi:hypothetical protein
LCWVFGCGGGGRPPHPPTGGNSRHDWSVAKSAFDAGLCLGSGLADTVTVREFGRAIAVKAVSALAVEMGNFRCRRATS